MSVRDFNFVEGVQKSDTLTARVTSVVILCGARGSNPINNLHAGAST